MKDDERWFLRECQKYCPWGRSAYSPMHRTPRDLISGPEFPMPYKRAWYLLEKWSKKGWYDYGVTLDLGWMTEKGMKVD